MSETARVARIAATELMRQLEQGCGDNSCRLKRPQGLGTNGGCRCKDAISDRIEAEITAQLRYLTADAGNDSCADYVTRNRALVGALKLAGEFIEALDTYTSSTNGEQISDLRWSLQEPWSRAEAAVSKAIAAEDRHREVKP